MLNLTSITLKLTGAHAWATVTGPLTAGMVGLPVTIEWDDTWVGLTKNLVCRCSPWGDQEGESRAILNVGAHASVAHEVMRAGTYLYLGVEGFRSDGTLVIPTTWARCGRIEPGASTCDDPSADPELPVWDQVLVSSQAAAESAASAARSEANASVSASSAAQLVRQAEQAQMAAETAANRAEAAAGVPQSVELTDLAGYKLSPGGLVLTAADAATQFVSEPVAVTAGEQLFVTASAKYGNSLYAFYDASGTMIANQTAPATEAGAAVEELALTAPTGAVSMRLSWDKGVSSTRYALVRWASACAGPLVGVKCAVMGDSVIEAAGVPNGGLVDLMARSTGAEIVNLGVGGTGFMQGQQGGNACYQRVAAIPADTKRVLLYGSGNDRELTLGDPADTGTDTVCGCVNAALDAVYAHVPTAWVGIVSPAPWQYFPPYNGGNAMELLAQALGSICKRRGVPYLDLYHCSGLRPWDQSFRELAYLNADGIHPNAAGYALIAPQCGAFLTGSV